MTRQENWPLISAIIVYWLVLSASVLAFSALFLGVGMTPGNYHMDFREALVFLSFPLGLIACKYLVFKLRRKPGSFKLLVLASFIPLVQILIVVVLI